MQTKHFEERLQEEKVRISRILGWVQSEALEDNVNYPESAPGSGDNEFADPATDTYTQELDAAMQARFRDRIRAIEGALQRIQTRQYGVCMRCGKAIPEERLEVVPETPFCVDCAREEEVEA